MSKEEYKASGQDEIFQSAVAEAIGREGILTVWDDRGRYVGCIGVETWHELLLGAEQNKMETSATAKALNRAILHLRLKNSALEAIRREVDLPEHLAELVGDALVIKLKPIKTEAAEDE